MKKVIKWGIIAFIVIMIIGAISSGGKSPNTTSNTNNTPSSQPTKGAPEEAIKLDTKSFVAEFDANKLTAEDKYKGKLVEFTGVIKNISQDVMGSYFLSIEPPSSGDYYFGTSIQCFFKDKSELTSLANKQTVKLQGRVDSMSLGIVVIKDCSVNK